MSNNNQRQYPLYYASSTRNSFYKVITDTVYIAVFTRRNKDGILYAIEYKGMVSKFENDFLSAHDVITEDAFNAAYTYAEKWLNHYKEFYSKKGIACFTMLIPIVERALNASYHLTVTELTRYALMLGMSAIYDMAGFLMYCEAKADKNYALMLNTIAHDINGMNERGMLPRTSDYGQFLDESKLYLVTNSNN